MAVSDHVAPAGRPSTREPGFWWRVLSPIGAVLAAFALLIVMFAALDATPLGDSGVEAVGACATSLVLLLFGVALWRGLPAHERRLAVEVKHTRGGALGLGLTVGVGLVIGAGSIIALGQAVDPEVERRLEDASRDLGNVPWQVGLTIFALTVLAPLGEELLFRGLLLRGLVRRMGFWGAATVSGLLFAAAHADTYTLWPRAISLVGTGVALAWLYRWRGYPASVIAHFTVNLVAAIALLLTD